MTNLMRWKFYVLRYFLNHKIFGSKLCTRKVNWWMCDCMNEIRTWEYILTKHFFHITDNKDILQEIKENIMINKLHILCKRSDFAKFCLW